MALGGPTDLFGDGKVHHVGWLNGSNYIDGEPVSSLGASVKFSPSAAHGVTSRATRVPVDARRAWLRFGAYVVGGAVGGFGLSVLCCYSIARIVAKSVEEHLRCLTVTGGA